MRDALLRVKQARLSLTQLGTCAIIWMCNLQRDSRPLAMFHRFTTLTRLTALVAVFAYTLLPATLLAKCGCGDCVCSVATDSGSCCCTGEVKAHSCCKPKVAGCPSCGHQTTAASAISSCACQPEYSSPAPSQPIPRSSALQDQAPTADYFVAALPVHRPQSDAFYPLADLDPTEGAPPLHLLNCVWRN
jgi:hypothetical protein